MRGVRRTLGNGAAGLWPLLCVALAGACTSLNEGSGGDDERDAAVRGTPDRDASTGGGRRDGGGSARDASDDSRGEDAGKDGGPGSASGCELDPDDCPMCDGDDDCTGGNPCRVTRCNPESGRCESTPRRDGFACPLGDGESGVCAEGSCAQCVEDDDCAPTALTCRRSTCTAEHACSTAPRPTGSPCAGGFCSAGAECVECALDENCGDNGACVDERCGCKPGYAPNSSSPRACNFDECARDDDNRCGPGGHCSNTDDGYSCTCDPTWKLGTTSAGAQCYMGGAGSVATVANGATWNMAFGFDQVCSNAFADPVPAECPKDDKGKAAHAQLVWLYVCGFGPPPCNSIATDGLGFATADMQRVSYSAALEDYGDPSGDFVKRIDDPVVGDVIVVRTLTTYAVMRVTSVSNNQLSFEWATIWRDHCNLPGGASCTAACSCPGGS